MGTMNTIRRSTLVLSVVLLLWSTVFAPLGHSEVKMLIAEATYTMGDGETPSFAEAQVLQRAKQIALEQAGTYVQSYTKIHNYNLTAEEIQTLAGGVLELEVLEKTRNLVGDGVRFYIKIKAAVTTDKMEELARRIKGKEIAEEYKKLQDEYARLSHEVETWKQRAATTPQGPEHDAALDQIREREKTFAYLQRSEAALFQRLVSGQALVAEAHDDKALIERLVESIKKDGHVIEIGKVSSFPGKGAKDRLTLTVPITLQAAPVLPTLLLETAQLLAGKEVRPMPTLSPGKMTSAYQLALDYRLSAKQELHVTVKTAPRDEQFPYIPLDNKYRDKYSIGTRGTVVELSPIRLVEDHFRERVKQLVLRIELSYDDPGIAPMNCGTPYIVNRLVVAQKNRHDTAKAIAVLVMPQFFIYGMWGKEKPFTLRPIVEDSVLLLFESVKFSVEFDLPSSTAKRVNRVTARWVHEQDVPQELCRIVVENN